MGGPSCLSLPHQLWRKACGVTYPTAGPSHPPPRLRPSALLAATACRATRVCMLSRATRPKPPLSARLRATSATLSVHRMSRPSIQISGRPTPPLLADTRAARATVRQTVGATAVVDVASAAGAVVRATEVMVAAVVAPPSLLPDKVLTCRAHLALGRATQVVVARVVAAKVARSTPSL